MKGTNMDAFGVSKAEKPIARSSGNPSGGRRLVHLVAPAPIHTVAASPKGRRVKNAARDLGSGFAGALPGQAMAVGGGALTLRDLARIDDAGHGKIGRVGPALVAASVPAMIGGNIGARQANLGSMNRKGYLKAEEKERVGKAETSVPRSSGNPSAGRRASHAAFGAWHTVGASPKGRRLKNYGRDVASTIGGGAPGLIVGASGATLAGRNPKAALGLMAGGGLLGVGGAQLARQANLGSMNRKGYLKAEEKERVGKSSSVSAFGVDHGEEVSKLSFKPITQGFKALKLGNAKTLPKTMGQSYKSGIASGQGKFNSGVNAAAVGVKHSPGIAAAGAGLGVAGVGGAGYAMGRRRD